MLQPTIYIRPAEIMDAESLSALATQTFFDTYAAYNSEADMLDYVSTHYQQKQIAFELQATGIYYFIALQGNEIIGYLKLRNNELPELAPIPHIELERIYVLTRYKGKGIGKLLLDNACKFSIKNNYQVLWLGVWKKNNAAIEFYKKQGFMFFGKQEFKLGNDVQTDWQYKKLLC